jgi:hypothetical protein
MSVLFIVVGGWRVRAGGGGMRAGGKVWGGALVYRRGIVWIVAVAHDGRMHRAMASPSRHRWLLCRSGSR